MAVADDKLRSIREILTNETYQMDSGMYQRLELALFKLPAQTLSDLSALIFVKTAEAARAARARKPAPAPPAIPNPAPDEFVGCPDYYCNTQAGHGPECPKHAPRSGDVIVDQLKDTLATEG